MGRLLSRGLVGGIVMAVALAGLSVPVGAASAGPGAAPDGVRRAQPHAPTVFAAGPRRGQRPGKVRGVQVGQGRTNGSAARLVVRWKVTPGAGSYRVRVTNNRAMRGGRTGRTAGTALAVGRLKAGRSYCFQVIAVRGHRRGAPSTRVCARTPKPVRAAGAVWVVAQHASGTSTRVTLKWHRTGRATSYDVLYAPGISALSGRAVKVRRNVRVSGRATESIVVSGLRPGHVNCFQVRGRSRTGVGRLGPPHCKLVQPRDRAVATSGLSTTVATFNVCGAAPRCQKVPWSRRGLAVVRTIASTGADVLSVQETRTRLPYLVSELKKLGYVEACSAAGAQAVFVRQRVFSVVSRTAGGLRFAGDRSHGACWVELRHRSSGGRLIASSIHLRNGLSASASRLRARESKQVLGLLEAAFGKVRDPKTPPFLLSGDFNSHRGYALDGPRKVLRRAGFDDAYDVAASYAAPYRSSAHGIKPRPRITTLWGSHVDRIFLPPGASASGWHTVMQLRGGRFVQPMPSDHSPVVITAHLPVRSGGGLLGGLFGLL